MRWPCRIVVETICGWERNQLSRRGSRQLQHIHTTDYSAVWAMFLLQENAARSLQSQQNSSSSFLDNCWTNSQGEPDGLEGSGFATARMEQIATRNPVKRAAAWARDKKEKDVGRRQRELAFLLSLTELLAARQNCSVSCSSRGGAKSGNVSSTSESRARSLDKPGAMPSKAHRPWQPEIRLPTYSRTQKIGNKINK